MSHLAPPTVASSRRRRLRQTGASALLAMGLVVTVFSAPSLAEDAVQGEGERAAAPSLTVAQCRDRATDAKPVADGCGDYKELLLREAAQRQQAAQRAAEVQAAAEREAEAKRQAEADAQAKREADARAAAEAAQDEPVGDLPLPVDPTDLLPVDPTLPTQPTEPTLPTQPTEPTLPTQPTEPTLPTQPTQPTQPTNPTQPTGPTLPTNTGQPSNPGGGTGPGDDNGNNGGGLGSDVGSPEGVIPGFQAAPAEVGSCGSSIVCSSTPTPTTTATGLPDTGAPVSGGLVGLGLAMVLGGLVLLRPRRGNGRHVMAL